MDQPNLYSRGSIVWLPDESCHGRVEDIFRPLGTAHYRYDVETDDGDLIKFIEEDRLYPATLPPIPLEQKPKPLAKVLHFPGGL